MSKINNISFDKIVDKVFDGFKKITPALVAISIVSGLILFLPTNILDRLQLVDLPQELTRVIGLMFVLSIALITTIAISIIFEKIKLSIKKKRSIKIHRKSFLNLPCSLKVILIRMLDSPSRSITLDSTSGDTLYLLQNGYIYQPKQTLTIFDLSENKCTYVPQPWLVDFYIEDPKSFTITQSKSHQKGGNP